MIRLLTALAVACAFLTIPQAAAQSLAPCPGPTPLGIGKPEDIVAGVGTPNNQVFWVAQDRHSPAKAAIQFDTTPALARPTPHLLLIGVRPDGRSYALNVPTVYRTSASPAAIRSPIASVAWVPDQRVYRMTVDVPGYFAADLRWRGHPGGAMRPATWDREQVTWSQSLGTATVDGWISFPAVSPVAGLEPPTLPGPGVLSPVRVEGWAGEQETMSGDWRMSPSVSDGVPVFNPLAPPTHIGYDYALSSNPDGSGDIIFTFPQLCGKTSGLLAHTTATGEVTVCEPTVRLSDWHPTSTGYRTWSTMTGECGGRSLTYRAQNALPVTYTRVQGWDVADGAVVSDVPGSTGVFQHLRQFPFYDRDI
ncbi:hypothetical protein D5S17_29545 [Pseudonocardiaceae bacterium YIM PH 21723]|nr:hypothetical protein D5S17_29545 [Pseudonocardiaceae bacterium YIM PH 21723]